MENTYNKIIENLKLFFQNAGFDKAVIGLSGGMDSALVVVLAAEALGTENVLPVIMPSIYSTSHSVTDSLDLVNNLNMEYEIIPIKDIFEIVNKSLSKVFEGYKNDVTEENIQARIRGLLLMAISNKQRRLLLNTSNKSELSVGYGTLYGDLCGSVCVLGNLYKTEVYDMARFINKDKEIIPWHIINKPPSAELRPDQKDTDSLPDYSILDPILIELIDKKREPQDIISSGFEKKTVERIVKLHNGSRFKMSQIPPILPIN
ncbi:MAG: NAD(+) synthase [Bacteroidales bacterium]|jgi:NAD+ synthase (glutamine-hydrolysing)